MKYQITNSLNEFIQALDIVDFDAYTLKASSFTRFKDSKDRHGEKTVAVVEVETRIYWGTNHRSGISLVFNPNYQQGKPFTEEDKARYQAYKLIRQKAQQTELEARTGKMREIVQRMRHLESLTFLEDHDLPFQYLWNKGLNPIGKKLCTGDPREIEAIVRAVYQWNRYTITDKQGNPTRAHVLIVPMLTNNETLGFQLITTDGAKRFISGSIMGYWQSVNRQALERAEVIAIGEGLATMLSIEAVCQVPVIVSFSAGRLPTTTRLIRALYPRAKLMVTGDRDQSQTGQNKALEAIKGITKAQALIPQWNASQEKLHPLLKTAKITDWNDYYLATGQLLPPQRVLKLNSF